MNREMLVNFCTRHKETKSQLETWYYEVRNSNWDNPIDVRENKEYDKINLEEI